MYTQVYYIDINNIEGCGLPKQDLTQELLCT